VSEKAVISNTLNEIPTEIQLDENNIHVNANNNHILVLSSTLAFQEEVTHANGTSHTLAARLQLHQGLLRLRCGVALC